MLQNRENQNFYIELYLICNIGKRQIMHEQYEVEFEVEFAWLTKNMNDMASYIYIEFVKTLKI